MDGPSMGAVHVKCRLAFGCQARAAPGFVCRAVGGLHDGDIDADAVVLGGCQCGGSDNVRHTPAKLPLRGVAHVSVLLRLWVEPGVLHDVARAR